MILSGLYQSSIQPGGVPVFAQVSALNAESSHQPLHPFAAHPDALAGQHGVDAWRAVGAARPLPDRLDPLRHSGISHLPHRRFPAAAVVEGGHRFADRGEQRRNPEGVTTLLHERRVGSASWAKNALANRKILLVRFSSTFSRRSRFSSSASLLVNRSSRSPPVGLVLTYPLAKRLGADPQLPGHISNRAAL
jgi:hypothetical protein